MQKLQGNAVDIEADGTVTVRPEPSALALFGSLKTRKRFPGLKAEKAAVRKHVATHAAHEGDGPTT